MKMILLLRTSFVCIYTIAIDSRAHTHKPHLRHAFAYRKSIKFLENCNKTKLFTSKSCVLANESALTEKKPFYLRSKLFLQHRLWPWFGSHPRSPRQHVRLLHFFMFDVQFGWFCLTAHQRVPNTIHAAIKNNR